MDLDILRCQTTAAMRLWAPQIGDASLLVDECLADAEKSLGRELMLSLSPQIWAKITLIYHKHFLDTQSDVSVVEMVAEVIRDSIETKRIDFLTQNLAVKLRYEKQRPKRQHAGLTLIEPKKL
ncbi:MAG: hypothetical protein P8163_06920 [Candidatus Thiodiazotropha sp.]